ncbi:FMN-binding protein [Nakamurella sp. A5-74]|uniref:FMN-binding protein n=1 Tax=Nakamurella sp. A5-74 TaxID=3158264 RepID=A0AAU8DR54_9ACTN
MTTSRTRLLLAGLGGLAVAGSAAGGVLLVQAGQTVEAAPSVRVDIPAPVTAQASSSAGTQGSLFRDGDYTSAGRYLTPGGDESILVTVHLRGGIVTSVVARTEALSPTARQFQEQFRVSVAAQVVARPLASVSVDVVAGASLTSSGFNNALAGIRAEARR